MTRRLSLGVVVGLVGLSLAIRAINATTQNLWFDEIVTMGIARVPAAELFHPTPTTPIQPTLWLSPLYFALLKAWLWLVPGPIDAVARWGAVMVGVGSVVTAAVAVASIEGALIGGLTGVCMALSPFHVWYSHEIRPYGLLLLLGAWAVAALHRGLDSPDRRPWGVFAATAVAAFYVHPLAVVLPVLAVVLGGAERVWQDPPRLRRWFAALAAIGVGMVPALLLVAARGGNAVADPRGATAGDLFYGLYAYAVGFSLGPSLTELHVDGLQAVRAVWPLVVLVGIVFGGLALLGWRQASQPRRLLAWGLAPFVVPGVLAVLSGNPMNVRYTILAYPAFVAALVLGARTLLARWPWRGAIVILLAVGLSGWSLWNDVNDPRYAKEDCRAVGRVLSAEAAADDIVLVNATYMEKAVAYYYDGAARVHGVYPSEALDASEPVAEMLDAEIVGHRTAWLVLSRTFHGDRDGVLPRLLAARFQPGPRWQFPGVTVQRFARE